jgi:dolichol-phosphate mannosyltransferase
MRDEAAPVQLGLHVRVRHGLRRPHNWYQLVRFTCVGASGYAVNLAVFAASVHLLAIDYRLAAGIAFLVAVTNNFLLNRHWTFDARDGHAGFQAARFFTVSLAAFAFNLLFLLVLVDGFQATKVPAQAVAIVIATPVSFLGNKLWSFRR